MTGRHTGHCTVRQNGQVLNSTDITIASILKKQGYQTALIGKWGLGKAPSYSSTVKASQSSGLHEHKQQQRELLSCVHTRSLTSRVSGNSINHRFLCACMKSGSVGIGQLSPSGSTDYPPATNVPNPEGFDFFLGYNSQENAHNYYPYFLLHNKVSTGATSKHYMLYRC